RFQKFFQKAVWFGEGPLVLKSGSVRFYAPLRASFKRKRLPAGKILKLPEPYNLKFKVAKIIYEFYT
ncbi:MAG TPA: hypothetical protein DCZ23_04375, partial [Lachnospiraceae bacterium]|nr:hypothetical protein [Lachnospiraceae bacterium]